jgi:hypothetical protein
VASKSIITFFENFCSGLFARIDDKVTAIQGFDDIERRIAIVNADNVISESFSELNTQVT